MWTILLIPFLVALFSWLLYWLNKSNAYAFSFREIALIYVYRVAIGCLYGYIFARYYHGDDTWYFHNGSIEEQQKLLRDPVQFFLDPNPIPSFQQNHGLLQGWYYYLSDLEFWWLTKPMALFNFISRGNYYVNITFFNFLTIWGSIWLYRLFLPLYPNNKRNLFIILFLLPFPLFWMTGIRAEGWLLFFIALALKNFVRVLKHPKTSNWVGLLIAFIGILILRSVLLFLLIPVLACWWLYIKKNIKPIKSFLLVFGIGLVLFWGSTYISSTHNLPQVVIKRQQAFLALHGQTRFELDSLQANPISFLQIFPQAINNTIFRPYLWEAKGLLQWITAGSVLFLLASFIIYLLRRPSNDPIKRQDPLVLSTILFGLLLYIFIGYTVPFPGAIVRYKSLGEYFLLLSLLAGIKWKAFIHNK